VVMLAIASFAATLSVGVGSLNAATIMVTNGNDAGAGSLRAALASAANGDTISFDPSVTEVVLTSDQLTVSTGVTISGPGADTLTVKRSTAGGTPTFRVFSIFPGAGNSATISGITIANGDATPGGGISFIGGSGTHLNLVRVAVVGNNATWGGGLDLTGSQASAVTIDSSSVTGNTTNGGVPAPGCCSNGAGMKIEAPTTIVNSTISGNWSASNGGGIKVDSNVTIINSTIANNSAVSDGGGIWETRFLNNPNLAMTNTLVADNTAGAGGHQCDVVAANTTLSVNRNTLIEDGSCNFLWASGAVSGSATNFLSGDPGLSALAYNGGTTKTQALASSSIARGAGDSAACAASPVGGVDQRGVTRPSSCSVGAFDGGLPAPSPTPVSGSPAPTGTAASTPLPSVSPGHLPLRLARSADGRGITLSGSVPDGADRVVALATRGATGAERLLFAAGETARVTTRCAIASGTNGRTFTCKLRLGAGRWTIMTKAMAGSTTLARAVSRMRVRAATRLLVTG